MKAVILVGGEGTRLRPLTCKIPKAIVPVLNQPFLIHLFSYLKKHNVEEAILAMGYNPKPIKVALAACDIPDIKIRYVIEDEPLGTAGAVKNAEKYLDDSFLVFNGDIITDIDLTEMIRLHKQVKPKVSIALTPIDNPTIYGVVETDADNMVERFVEKPAWEEVTTNMINAGVYILEPEVLSKIPESSFYMFERGLFPGLLEAGEPILSYKSNPYWIDIGTPQKYLKVNFDLLHKLHENNIVHEGDSNVNSNAKIMGTVLIGKNCNIGSGVRITGPVILGANCNIKENSIVESSVLWNDVMILENCSIKDCIIGAKTTIQSRNNLLNCVIGDEIVISPESEMAANSSIWPEGCADND